MAEPANRPPSLVSRAVLWGVGGSFVRIGIQLLAQITLARLLGPDTYGVFIACSLVIALLTYLADSGIAYALVHRERVDAGDTDFVLTWQAIIGATASLLVLAVAPLVAAFVGEARMLGPLRALAAVLFLVAMAAPATNLLRRRMAFREIQVAQLGSYVAGYVLLGLPLALAGAGVWALVVAWLVQAAVYLAMVMAAQRPGWSPRLRHPDARGFLRFASVVLVTNVVNWWVGNLDKVLVARLFTPATVGLYGTAFNLVNTPVLVLQSTVNAITFSATSRLRGDTDGTARSYLTSLAIVLLVGLPVAVVLALLAQDLTLLLYGPAWRGAGDYLGWFALMVPLLMVWGVSTPVLWNAHRISQEVRLQAVVLAALAAALWWTGRFSALAMVQAQFGVLLLRTGYGVLSIAARLGIGRGALLAAVLPSAGLALGAALGAALGCALAAHGASAASGTMTAAAVVVAAGAAGAALGTVAVCRLLAGWLPADVQASFQSFSLVLPAPAGRLLRWLLRIGGTT